MVWNGTEFSVWNTEYERCQNGMEGFMNGMEDNLPYQFHARFRLWHLQKNRYGWW